MRRERTRGKTSAFVRATAASALVVPLAVALVACGGTATATDFAPSPVRIGAIYNLTGAQSALDDPSLDGARLAVDRINARGGLMGRRVELLERDGQTNEADVKRAAASLVASGCSAIIGLSDTDQVLAAAPIAARAGVPFVTSGATSPRLAKQVPNWLFLACFGDNAQAAASAQFATDQLGARTAAILYDEDMDYTRLLAKYFERSFRAQGGNVVASADYKQAAEAVPRLEAAGDTGTSTGSGASGGSAASGGESSGDTSGDSSGEASQGSGSESSGDGGASAETATTVTRASTGTATNTTTSPARSADVLFVAAGPADAARIVRRLRAAGYDQPVMGGDSFDSRSLTLAAEKTGGKVYYTTHAAIGMSSASRAVRRFDASFQAAYGRPPENAFAALGYDAIDLVASAIRRADSVKPAKIRDALQATRHFPGVTGTLRYDGKDRVPRKKVTVVCVGRRPVVVAQFTPGYVPRP
jgi:ABC-type branched-subunit amino acid transport system substrate-binding protein